MSKIWQTSGYINNFFVLSFNSSAFALRNKQAVMYSFTRLRLTTSIIHYDYNTNSKGCQFSLFNKWCIIFTVAMKFFYVSLPLKIYVYIFFLKCRVNCFDRKLCYKAMKYLNNSQRMFNAISISFSAMKSILYANI